MDLKVEQNHTLYAIFLHISRGQEITVGKLGSFYFSEGMYIYVGSAKKNIEARLRRHQQIDKKLRWHFDYLRPYGEINKIITYENQLGECGLAEKLRKEYGGMFPVKGFGSSDCSCCSHLIYYKRNEICGDDNICNSLPHEV